VDSISHLFCNKKNEEKILQYLIVASCLELILRKKAAIHLLNLKWWTSRVAAGSGESEKEHQLEIWGWRR
jgi:hypothetical protein